jgi:hypothetical protein
MQVAVVAITTLVVAQAVLVAVVTEVLTQAALHLVLPIKAGAGAGETPMQPQVTAVQDT